MTSRSWARRPSWSTSAAMPAASLSTANNAVFEAIHIQPHLADVNPDHAFHPLSPPCLRACADQPFGLSRTAGAGSCSQRRAQSLGSFRSPTPRAHPVHGVGAPPPCHIPARQGSFGLPIRAPASEILTRAAGAANGARRRHRAPPVVHRRPESGSACSLHDHRNFRQPCPCAGDVRGFVSGAGGGTPRSW